MASHYTRRLLPLLDVMMLLFGLLMILLVTANFVPASPTPDETGSAPPPADSERIVNDLLAGKPFVFLEVTRDLQVRQVIGAETFGRSLGTLEQFNKDDFELLIANSEDNDVSVLVFYQAGLASRRFTPELQAELLKILGENRAILTRKPQKINK